MRYKPNELERLSMTFDAPMKRLEDEIMTDIVRRIRINSEITRSADWQIHRLYELGMSRQDIEKRIQNLTGISPQEVKSLYSQILEKGYAEDEKIYRLKGKPYIPFEENEQLQQLISATAAQTSEGMQNITQSLGFAIKNAEGKTEFLPIAKYYQSTLDKAMLGITSGAFDYNTILKKTVAQLTNSGLRTIDYASGRSNRVEVAARRAVMTGFNQIVAKVNEENADKLETEYFEVSWHGGARPTHQVWQGRVYSKKDLETVCGLGDVQGLCGANCYHSYHPFDPEIDVRTYTDEQLDEMNRQENTPVEFGGKQYTKYEALQRQRRLETTMRAERQTIKLLQEGGASEDEIMLARGRYRVTSSEYTRFSKAMNLPQQRERVTVDGLGNIGVGKYKLPDNISKPVVKNSTSNSNITQTVKSPDKYSKDYKPVILNEQDTKPVIRPNATFTAYKSENTVNNLYISEGNKNIKRKELHQIDNQLTEVLKKMGISEHENLPNIYIINSKEMNKNAVASYRAFDNSLFIDSRFAVYSKNQIPEGVKTFACAHDSRSTFVHELFHWKDAQDFRNKFGEITPTNYGDYEKFVQSQAKKRLDKLQKDGHNIFVSEYGKNSYKNGIFDETYAEYRVWELLTGG